ncbi:MAG: thiamine phosphate synthase [Candidatus Zixiibacteriota bacterium]
MMGKEELLSKIQLYVIVDKKICGDRDVEDVVRQTIEGGAQMIQYRDKDSGDADFLSMASKLRAVCKERGVPFIVNDRTGIALEVDANGVHLGQKDLSINEARKILGPAGIIGKSASTIDQAKKAEKEGADYLGFGPIFETLSKEIAEPIGLSIVPEARHSLRIPFYLIGGITKDNLDQIIEAGATRIAVISAVVLSDDVKSATAGLLKKLETST